MRINLQKYDFLFNEKNIRVRVWLLLLGDVFSKFSRSIYSNAEQPYLLEAY